jgi:hypothetical protein
MLYLVELSLAKACHQQSTAIYIQHQSQVKVKDRNRNHDAPPSSSQCHPVPASGDRRRCRRHHPDASEIIFISIIIFAGPISIPSGCDIHSSMVVIGGVGVVAIIAETSSKWQDCVGHVIQCCRCRCYGSIK